MSWLDFLESAIQTQGLKAVASRLGYATSSISLARHGRYVGSTARIEAAVLAHYGRVACPFLGFELVAEDCRHFSSRPTPTSNPGALRHWAACQECPFSTHARRAQ